MQFLSRVSADIEIKSRRAAYIEEMQLVSCAANAVCEEEDISLQPGHFLRRILETNSWTAHIECVDALNVCVWRDRGSRQRQKVFGKGETGVGDLKLSKDV